MKSSISKSISFYRFTQVLSTQRPQKSCNFKLFDIKLISLTIIVNYSFAECWIIILLIASHRSFVIKGITVRHSFCEYIIMHKSDLFTLLIHHGSEQGAYKRRNKNQQLWMLKAIKDRRYFVILSLTLIRIEMGDNELCERYDTNIFNWICTWAYVLITYFPFLFHFGCTRF